MVTLAKWEDIPLFEDELEEAAFWDEHRLDLRLMDQAIASGFGSNRIRVHHLANGPADAVQDQALGNTRSRYLNYQSMMKQWLQRADGRRD